MNVKVNDKITWKDKHGRLLPGIVTSLDKYDDVPEPDLNGCICISVRHSYHIVKNGTTQ